MGANTGKFVWYDLMTTDVEAAKRFYGSVLGWTAKDAPTPANPYSIFTLGETMIAGVMPLPGEAKHGGTPPCWTGYVAVEDVQAKVHQVVAEGGRIWRPVAKIPGIGYFAVVGDPHGAPFILFQANTPQPPKAEGLGKPGHIGWHELHTGNSAVNFDFYARCFKWTKGDALDMGPAGTYQLFYTPGQSGGSSAGERAHPKQSEQTAVGGMIKGSDKFPKAYWLYYFYVANIDEAATKVHAAGGKVVNGPHPVPGGAWVLHARDPQNAYFALVGMRE